MAISVKDALGVVRSLLTFDLDAAGNVKVATPVLPGVVCGQAAVGVAAAAIGAASLVNGVTIKASDKNSGDVFVGGAGVTTTDDGTGNSFKLSPGESIGAAVTNLSALYTIGTAGDFIYYMGN